MSSDSQNDKLAAPSGEAIKQTPTGRKIGLSGLHNRMKQAASSGVNNDEQAIMMPNRIAVMLDSSGSMGGYAFGKSKIEHLHDAMQGFIAACDFSNSAVAMETFGAEPELSMNLSVQATLLLMTATTVQAHGGTPMGNTMRATLAKHSITRGIIISDGQADSESFALEQAHAFAEAEIPVDTVHIDQSDSGADLLKQIAEITGGIFIKFDNVANFAKNFKYLTPNFRAMLTAGDAAALIGAKEVKI